MPADGDGLELSHHERRTVDGYFGKSSGPTPNMAQVDPPHPFKSILKTLVIAAIVVTIALGLYVYLAQKPPVASGEVLAATRLPDPCRH